jgi:hypothetical protein
MGCMETVTPGAERAIRNEVLRCAMAQWTEREATFASRTSEVSIGTETGPRIGLQEGPLWFGESLA